MPALWRRGAGGRRKPALAAGAMGRARAGGATGTASARTRQCGHDPDRAEIHRRRGPREALRPRGRGVLRVAAYAVDNEDQTK